MKYRRWVVLLVVFYLTTTTSELPEGCPNAADSRCWQLVLREGPTEAVARVPFLVQPGFLALAISFKDETVNLWLRLVSAKESTLRLGQSQRCHPESE